MALRSFTSMDTSEFPLEPVSSRHVAARARIQRSRRLRSKKPYNEMSTSERLAVDIERVAMFRMEATTGITDEVWETQIRPDLMAFALAPSAGRTMSRLVGMILKGRIFERRVELGAPRTKDVCSPIPELSVEEAHDLAHNIVERMLPHFRKNLMGARWDGTLEGAAPLGSWFTNLCCYGFAASWRPFMRQREATAELMGSGELDPGYNIADPSQDTEGAVIYDVYFNHYLEYVNERDQVVVRLDSLAEFTDEQIGELVGLNRRQVERRKGKARETARRRRAYEYEIEKTGVITSDVA